MGSCHNRQPAGQLLLTDTTIGEEKNFVWEEPGVDLPQQFTGVLGGGVTGDEDLFGLREPKIESGGKRRKRGRDQTQAELRKRRSYFAL